MPTAKPHSPAPPDSSPASPLEQETLGAGGGGGGGLVLRRGTGVGRFVLLERLGAGGMGVVYSAYDGRLDRRVALKLLRPDVWGPLTSEAGRERLLREAQAMARLSHPNVVTVYEVGTWEGQLFVAMEYVEGQTLSAWLKAVPRSPREVLQVLVAAGRGLAAAHAKGLVHRDFKPDNVLVGADGQVRVTDFGLVREEGEQAAGLPAAEVPPAADGTSQLTQSGMVMGTPGFIAPEQYAGARVDARADQYAFCSALYLALFGRLPVEGDSKEALREATLAGRLAEPPAEGGLPVRLRLALRRGLRTSPAERFASMEALLSELESAVAPPRARAWPWGAAAAAALLLGTGLLWRAQASGEAVCQGAEARLAGVWDGPVRASLRQALEKAGGTVGAALAPRVEARLDAYAQAWKGMHTEACEATAVRKEQSPQLLDLRMACLERRRSALRATTALLASTTEAGTAARALELVEGLEGLSACADAEALTAAYPPPPDASTREQVQALRARAEESRVLQRAGKYKESLAVAEEVLASALPVGYPPLSAEALVQLGRIQSAMNITAAEATLQEGARTAALARDDTLLASAWTYLVWVLGWQARNEEALLLGQLAETAIVRAGDVPELRATLENHLGRVYHTQARYPEAAGHFERSVTLWTEDAKASGGMSVRLASAINNLGVIYKEMGRYAEARAHHQRALDMLRRTVGEEHPLAAKYLDGLAQVVGREGKLTEDVALGEASLRIKLRLLRPDDTGLAISYSNLGITCLALGRLPEARAHLEKSLAIFEKRHGPEHPNVGSALLNLGAVAVAQHRFAEAQAIYTRARHLFEKTEGPAHPDVASVIESEGSLQASLGRYAQSRRSYAQALSLRERAGASDPSDLAGARIGLGEALLALGQAREAALHLERAEKAVASRPVEGLLRGTARFDLARALWSSGQQRPRALELAQAAVEDLRGSEAHEARERLSEAQAWLAARSGGARARGR